MSTLTAIAYPDRETAQRVRQELVLASQEHLVDLDDAVVVERQADGTIRLHQAMHTAAAGAAGGALWGGLIGLLFIEPLLGMAVGAASGGVAGGMAGEMTDVGVNDGFLRELGAKLEPGAAALIVLGRSDAPDKLVERVRRFGGHVVQTSLSNEEDKRLRSALGEGVAAS